jgi:hypothetical protein
MESCRVIKLEIPTNPIFAFPDTLLVMQIHFVGFDRFSPSFRQNVIKHPTSAIHANPDPMSVQHTCERRTCKLAALIAGKNLRCARNQNVFQGLKAKHHILGCRNRPGHHIAAKPIQNSHQVPPATHQPNLGDLGGPDLMRTADRHPTHQRRIHSMLRMPLTELRLRINRLKPYRPPQLWHPLKAHHIAASG